MAEKGKVVYVGSIPYDQTEEQLIEIFKSVGPVAHVRLVLDKDTGKSKGFGFVEYFDIETAASAVRNLNDYMIGTRSLKVDFSHETMLSTPGVSQLIASPASSQSAAGGGVIGLDSLPAGTPPPTGKDATTVISRELSAFTREQLLNVVRDIKSVISSSEQTAQELLNQCPQLSYAIMHCLLELGLVSADMLPAMLLSQQSAPAAPVAAATVSASEASLPPVPSKQNTSKPNQVKVDPEQVAVIKQVLQMTPDQIASLPEDQRQAVLQIIEKVRNNELQV